MVVFCNSTVFTVLLSIRDILKMFTNPRLLNSSICSIEISVLSNTPIYHLHNYESMMMFTQTIH